MRCLTCSQQRGLTLIEVLASLALLGALFTGVLIGKSRLTQQWSASQARLAAIERAGELLDRWHANGELPAEPSSGRLPDGSSWSTTLLPPDQLDELGYRRIRFILRPPGTHLEETTVCRIDYVVAAPPTPTEEMP